LLFSGHAPAPQCLSCTEGPKTEHSTPVVASAKYRGTIISLVQLATPFLIQARMLLAFLATWARCQLVFSLPVAYLAIHILTNTFQGDLRLVIMAIQL